MTWIPPLVLVFVGLLHLLPAVGVLGRSWLHRLYDVDVGTADLEVLMRHRAVLFGLLGGLLLCGAASEAWRWPALVAGLVSVAAFLVLCWGRGPLNAHTRRVERLDWAALVGLLLAIGVELYSGG